MVQTRAMATGVAIIGIMKTARQKPRSGNSRWNTTAAAIPSTTGSDHRQEGEVEGAADGLDEAGVAGELEVVAEPDEVPLADHRPVVHRQEDREQPGEQDDGQRSRAAPAARTAGSCRARR